MSYDVSKAMDEFLASDAGQGYRRANAVRLGNTDMSEGDFDATLRQMWSDKPDASFLVADILETAGFTPAAIRQRLSYGDYNLFDSPDPICPGMAGIAEIAIAARIVAPQQIQVAIIIKFTSDKDADAPPLDEIEHHGPFTVHWYTCALA